MPEDRDDDATADKDGGGGIAVAMELRNYGLTELRKQAAWLRINGFTNQWTHKVRNYRYTDSLIYGQINPYGI